MSAARTLRQLSSVSGRLSTRTLSTLALRRIPLAAARVSTSARAFSASARAFKAGSSDIALVQKLSEELSYEHEEMEKADKPDFLAAFESRGIWKIQDTPGSNEVVLTRQFGNENIRLVFSIADLNNQEEMYEEDPENPEEEAPEEGTSIRVVVSISKSTGPGGIDVEMLCQNGQFLVETVSHYPDAVLGQLTVEADWKRRELYVGPDFSTLDIQVQEALEKFLEERDINPDTALFIPEYATHKEQREYVSWLENVKKFVEA
ncbi:mitochondrial glycoprotein [Roridomyces roridus]|uniref:Mitochondrial glycoprotein n=1 Tax=Roridomyces roridus TaxID=1738132 RepID=A0AAD7FR15_9AGAR|nr:mitochondrial glycoprotein [Roridomyces roridus]